MERELVLGHVGMGTGEVEPFDAIYSKGKFVRPEEIKNGAEIDALVIWGGEDISPSLYGDEVSKYTYAGATPSRRDVVERDACLFAIGRGIPLIGVCRGAQLLCAIAGGKLIQHVNGHGVSHKVSTSEGEEFMTTSVHHQMMVPWDVDHKLLAWSTERRSNVYYTGAHQADSGDERMFDFPEPEIVWFPKIKGLAIQGHPEFVSNPRNSLFVQYCLKQVTNFCLQSSTVTEVK